MPNTFVQINIHIVFAVKGRHALISTIHKEELYKYITGIIKNKKIKLLAIGGMPDHIHIFISMPPDIAIADLVRDVKRFSTEFINDKKWINGKFYWQEGFGAFSYSNSQIPSVIKYVQEQEKHHAKKTFKEEYIKILEDLQVKYDKKYLFDWIEEK